MIKSFVLAIVFIFLIVICDGLREFRSWSTRSSCHMANFPNYPFAYSKYLGQSFESKGRVNSNEQDFRHECQVRGGRSKCHICENINCLGFNGTCFLQLQGVNSSAMSINIPTVTDTSWAVGGLHRHDYGGKGVSHFCVFLSGGACLLPQTSDFSKCITRCFGHGFSKSAKIQTAPVASITDLYPGMEKWPDDGMVDLWAYPRNCSDLTSAGGSCSHTGHTPSFNPQGFTFTLAGSTAGFKDGTGTAAQFNGPQDVAADSSGTLYVADTANNAIRIVAADGTVTTLAGRGASHKGYANGDCTSATFSQPKGLDVRLDVTGTGAPWVVIVVADTGNHRLRRIDYVLPFDLNPGSCTVSCLTGLCGNNTLSATDFKILASPQSGYADGDGLYARFSAPESVVFMPGNFIAVADTGNFLIRLVADNGSTSTLAGKVQHGQTDAAGMPAAGCAPPCLAGQQGYDDGNLTHAQFYNILDLTMGPNNTLWVVDENRVRMVTLPNVVTTLYTVQSEGWVFTMAGNALQGHDDGVGDKSTFFNPSGVVVTADNLVHVVDSASCRVRRVTPLPLVAQAISCTAIATQLIRPSGCTSFDQVIDAVGKKVSRVEANIQYNYGWPYSGDLDKGKYVKNCVGSPPHDTLDKHFLSVTGDNLVIDDDRVTINEDSEQGTAIVVFCPAKCSSTVSGSYQLLGNIWYSEGSSVCMAALHSGVLSDAGGYVQLTVQRRDYLLNLTAAANYTRGARAHGLLSGALSESAAARVFSLELFHIYMNMVHTVGGHAMAPLQSGCGFADAQPPSLALFNNPSGVTAVPKTSLSDTSFLYIADTDNNRIRGMSAVCTQICENGGSCIAHDKCSCPAGWSGLDCTLPSCSSGCASNQVCVAPNTCACKPGYTGALCITPQCVQQCRNGGQCSAPDTCSCATGWFDANCTTPVCSNTCANGGNCTAPNLCACPAQWTGRDCRMPVCEQTCLHGGFCVAPNTCACPPQYINFDCSVPVCTQGYFVANPGNRQHHWFANNLRAWPTYKYCDMQSWCNSTHEFECDQQQMWYGIIEVPSGPEFRAVTGRKAPPTQCMNIELPILFKLPFELLNADNTTTGNLRYAPLSPYESNNANAWRGFTAPTTGHTGPWAYSADRQLANVNWLNMSQGVYVCANDGNCTAPGVCECAPGWIGFDCRTPVCGQGYYHREQTSYVSGMETDTELERFLPFMGNNSYYLNWPYSNPNWTMQWEFYSGVSEVDRQVRPVKGTRYHGASDWSSGVHRVGHQGGYRCSVRALTPWENTTYIIDHPNYYSRYMGTKTEKDGRVYTFWEGMHWPAIHQKSKVLDQQFLNTTYAYSNEGYRRHGVWNVTGRDWEYGVCVMQFYRNCSEDPRKEFDLQAQLRHKVVQDTDLAYRPRIFYNDMFVYGQGRWNQAGGECIDQVQRGCFNNGTCVAPDTCACSAGWSGYSCNVPVCQLTCLHHGNCTGPDQCTCERGWTGPQCATPLCAQECQNGGYCVAPDVCKCNQWPTTFRDGRLAGGRPLFQDPRGDPLNTGWTGFDCSVPICVQGNAFYINVHSHSSAGFESLGGHGADGTLPCVDNGNKLLPRCPQYDIFMTGNDGTSFQTGCGFDPYDTGCCLVEQSTQSVSCFKCDSSLEVVNNNSYVCKGAYHRVDGKLAEKQGKFAKFLDANQNLLLCGKYHSPRNHNPNVLPEDYGVPGYYTSLDPHFSSYNFMSNLTSNRFLCNIDYWTQGDYIDDAGLGAVQGVGSIFGLDKGRHVRINTPNMLLNVGTGVWSQNGRVRGEGVYSCSNGASCLGPDVCSCTDGYSGFDCNTPICRHLQPTGAVSSCLNGGICALKDQCNCVQTESVSWLVDPSAARGVTGWTGSDCSIPMCTQGFFDPFCTDLPQAPAGEGCFRCSNGGNCTAPDICTCAKGWSGFDCRTPLCEVVADPLTRTQLGSVFEDKIVSFETDPCGLRAMYGVNGWHGQKYARGNCTQPNQCTCLCKDPYVLKECHKTGMMCNGPWQDPMVGMRNLMTVRGPMFTFGSTDCAFGYEGNMDEMDRFVTCHQTIYVPSSTERSSVTLIITFSVLGFICAVAYHFISAGLRKKFLLAKIERRRSKRSSEDSITRPNTGAFVTK